MITKWKIFNFKSIQKETELDFAPLTIFAGANSSGKSTVLQSILLISQTLAHKISSRSVVLNGSLLQLGQFDDLRSIDGDADQIAIGWECRPFKGSTLAGPGAFGSQNRLRLYRRRRESIQEVSCEISFDTNPSGPDKQLYQLQPQLFTCQLSVLSRSDDNLDAKSAISITRAHQGGTERLDKIHSLQIEELDNDIARTSLAFDVKLDDESMSEVREDNLASAEPIGCMLRHFLPERLSLKVNIIEQNAQNIASFVYEDRPLSFLWRYMSDRNIVIPENVLLILKEIVGEAANELFTPTGSESEPFIDGDRKGITLLEWCQRKENLSPRRRKELRELLHSNENLSEQIIGTILKSEPPKFEIIPKRLPEAVMEASMYLDDFFTRSLKYLGPLRDEPKPLYPLAASTDPADVGLRGEMTASVLDLHKARPIRYIPTSRFSSAAIEQKTSTRTLETAVIDWLQYLGVADNVQSQDLGKLGHELKVTLSKDDKPHDLTHVGVGVSQVLPILVACLLAESDTTLILEQPELHLHPRVQTLLGDFFMSMAILRKQCIIETHSEYLINRLRFRAAAASEKKSLTSYMKIYFVEKENNSSTFRDVAVNEYGAIVDWPEGFFDQSQREAEKIVRAAARKRKEKRNKGRDA